MQIWSDTSWTEAVLLVIAFVLCAIIGIERQVRQKSAGFRTHVLVGMGAAGFTLVSAFGFSTVLGEEVNLDPSRIAAQIVSGIGFLGAGVIFTRRDVVRGLTTAATIWVAAAVGMAAGAGMVSLAVALTLLHLLAVLIVGPLVLKIPTRDHNRVLRITYLDGAGVLRDILALATELGFSILILGSRRLTRRTEALVAIDIRFKGRAPLRAAIPEINAVNGVHEVEIRRDDKHEEDGEDVS